MYPKGTLLRFSLFGGWHAGFVIGTCDFDGTGDDNAYVLRLVTTDPLRILNRSFTVVDKYRVEPILNWPEDFLVLTENHSEVPPDRCEEWVVARDENSLLIVISKEKQT